MTPANPSTSALWLIFLTYWLVAALRTKRSRTPGGWQGIALRALLILATVALFQLSAIDWFAQQVQWRTGIGTNVMMVNAGVALCALGIALAIWSRAHLGRNWGLPTSLRDNHDLVTSGPYARTRHPIYSGLLLALFGSALAEGTLSLAIFFVFCAYFYRSARIEERMMAEEFPSQYPAYQRRTKMLIPYVL
jgi:protein-S-isoprenylcysteine O-methyltransferase Ste14